MTKKSRGRPGKGIRLTERSGIYVIIDGDKRTSTRTRDRMEAEGKLAEYKIQQHAEPAETASTHPATVTVNDVLKYYAHYHLPHIVSQQRRLDAIARLEETIGSLTIDKLNGATCRYFIEERGVSDGTVRLELGALQAAINFCVREGILDHAKKLPLPKKPASRTRWLERDEAAKLLCAAWMNKRSRHLARFILIALYTGTRTTNILNLKWKPHANGGWIDTENGLLYRETAGAMKTNKRAPTIPIPRRLLPHLKRWEKLDAAKGREWVIEYAGKSVASLKKTWANTVDSAGIDPVNKHDLRHTCASWLMQSGNDIWKSAKYLGMSPQILEDVYGHFHPNHLRDIANTF